MARILGIESSCDETAAAIVADGRTILSNVISSQIDLHSKYGGVVPELAARAHLERIVPVVREAFAQAQLAYGDVDAIAVTQGPGLIGSLLVGVAYAKAMAWSLSKPLIGVNHLEGHIHAVLLEAHQKGEAAKIEFPVVTLVVSGGHTALYYVSRPEGSGLLNGADAFRYRYRLLGQTVDDAAGEAYDKVAKFLGLGYPGGPVIDRLAERGNSEAVVFTRPNIKRGRPHDFSFSGIKTAVVRLVEKNGLQEEIAARLARRQAEPQAPLDDLCSPRTLDLLASFQRAVVEDLTERTLAAADEADARTVFVSGGVAANSLLRKIFAAECAARGVAVFFPSVQLSTDNAAMIAAAAWPRFQAGEFADPVTLNASASLPLGV
ncbi:MAG: tRNA (adenosine(37)-N6)-threonylcarbamoyltransferase complex transferase subunit TsaD [Acidobacteria bacterium RIFCSPHIGHO2_12_FULL_67_30]|nr:MAG: tRNA (adenosine(37)-N6)-threonylcarbamoyltransferase complex transferase subunit TsaD [Acidobacteria bacterium RIFCSPHIGHO2_12_FULL_67_30]